MSETTKTDGAAVGKDDLNKLLLDGLEKGLDEASRRQYKEGEAPRKFLGIELDPTIAYVGEVAYNTFIGKATKLLRPKTYGTALKLAKDTLHLSETSANRTAAAVAFAVNTGVYALPSLGKIYDEWSHQHDARNDLVEKLSPVLDDIKGRHGTSAYNGVRVDQNEMVAFDRWRRTKIGHTKLLNMILPTVVTIGPNIWFHERDTLKAAQTGRALAEVQQERLFAQVADEHSEEIAKRYNEANKDKSISADDVTHEHVAALKDDYSIKNRIESIKTGNNRRKAKEEGFSMNGFAGQFGSNALLTKLAGLWVKSSDNRIKRQFNMPYTALEMVLTLHDQLGNEPKPSTFQLPGKGRSLPLEAYIAEIMMQHQRDMAVMNPDYAVIRDALKENVLAAAKPLAEAIRKNQIGAMSLVSYVGTGKIIRNRGRMIATADEVEAMIEHEKTRGEAKPKVAMTVDAKDFWADASYTKDEGKEAFEALHGEERQLAITFVPPNLWKDFGIGEKEGKEAIDAFGKEIETHLAEAILGINALDDDTLRKEGLAKAEIRKIREAAKAIEHKGAEAVSQLKSSESHPNGVDREVLGVVVGTAVKGDKVHLGTILKDGREQLKEMKSGGERKDHRRHEAANDDDHPDHRHLKTHAEREDHRRGEAANHGHARGAMGE